MLLGREFRRAKRAADLTQERLAAKAKVDRTYISDIENDEVSPTVEMLERLCKALGVRTSEILARVEAGRTRAGDEGKD